jgi:SAM-dependent methyltransferase
VNDTLSDIQEWNRIADNYAQMIGTPDDHIYLQFQEVLWDSLGDIHGLDVLDLGCGHGWLSKEMFEAGASVWGIDGSVALLQKARQLCPRGEFIEFDLSAGLPDTTPMFDRIIAYMVLMDIPDISNLLQSVRRVLRANSKFVFTIPHPCFFNYKSHQDEKTGQMFCAVTGYLQPEMWWIESYGGHRHYHRSLMYYFEKLRAHRLSVTRLYEPSRAYTTEHIEFHRQIPKFMLIEAMPI